MLSKVGDMVPQAVKDMEAAGNTAKREVLYVIAPRNNRIVKMGEKMAPSRRPWEYTYIDKATQETCGVPGGYYEMPIYAPRWRKTTTEAKIEPQG